jgi:hypothetical protein
VARDGSAKADFDVVGVGAEDQQVDRHALGRVYSLRQRNHFGQITWHRLMRSVRLQPDRQRSIRSA